MTGRIAKNQKKGKRKRKKARVAISYINMQGGRKKAKWLEIEEQLNKEQIGVYAVTETHLRDLEEPPHIKNYVWEGCNRTISERKGGGVGMLIHRGAKWVRVKQTCSEHLWVLGTVGGKETWLGVAYLWTGNNCREKNQEIVDCMSADIKEFGNGAEIILLGDMNAHIHDLDGYSDTNGKLLLDLCEQHSLEIVNTGPKCDGQITWEVGNKQSSIDYCLMTEGIYHKLTEMRIDEEGINSLGSDHKRITLQMGYETENMSMESKSGSSYLNDKQIINIAARVEEEVGEIPGKDWEYRELLHLMTKEIGKEKKTVCWKGKRKPKSWWNKEIREAIEKRREASREHRKAKKEKRPQDEVKKIWEIYLEKKSLVQKLVEAKIKGESERWMTEIHEKKEAAPRIFWSHIKALGRKSVTTQQHILDEGGNQLEGYEALGYIQKVTADSFQKSVQGISPVSKSVAEKATEEELVLDNFNWKKAEGKIPKRTAAGLDGIPVSLINELGHNTKEALLKAVEKSLKDGQIPDSWRQSRMNLIYKGKGEKDKIRSYRPLTITSVLYRLAMQAVKMKIETWAEHNDILGELQNGFRVDRRLDDNLFVLTQCIEISKIENRPLYVAFLDITGAYDNVNQEILWDILKGMGMGDDCIQLLREIYRENTVCIEWEGMRSKENVEVSRGLRQGCPLSPLLFMLYMVSMEKALEGSNIGFNLSHKQGGMMIEQKLPGLFYADDIVLFADSRDDIQQLANICGREGEALGLGFSVTKCGLMVFNDPCDQTVSIQGQEIPRVSEYKYLGVWVNESDRYMEVQEKASAAKGKRNAAIMKHRALWGYNRYEVLRGLWKGVMVPGLTFGNSVVCMRAEVQSGMDVNQRTVGRLALGAHGKTTNEAVKGDMGWAGFEAREAQSKIRFEERLRNMKESRWAEKVFRYLYRKSVDTQWRKRTRRLTSKYTAGIVSHMSTKSVKGKVREAERIYWMAAMEKKPALSNYRKGKNEIRREAFYDNSRGSALLFEARSGCLRTRSYKARFSKEEEQCTCCGKDKETAEHVLIECGDIHPGVRLGTSLQEALGFRDNNGKLNTPAIEISKRRLEYWWQKIREKGQK